MLSRCVWVLFNRWNLFKFSLVICCFVTVKIYLDNKRYNIQRIEFNYVDKRSLNDSVNIKIFDLRRELQPASVYTKIKCRKSSEYYVRTTLCMHDLKEDVHVSGSISRDGMWEPHVLKPFLDFVNANPGWLVIDIGAQIGQYSLFAATLGRDVLAVEPFYDNIIRIHKAATKESIQDRITLITNAVSNKRNEVKLLQRSRDNIGGQSLLNHKDKQFNKSEIINNKYLVETILLDDIIEFLPKINQKTNKKYTEAILKIDIEGFEPYAFEHAKELFNVVNIKIIFMEWGSLSRISELHESILNMIEFLVSRKFSAYGNNAILDTKKWATWPWDVVWKAA